jgi:MFS family permease
MLSVSKSNPLFLFSAFIIGTGNGITMPSFQTMINALVPRERRGAANSTFFAGFDIGIGIGMILIGFLAEKSGLRISFLVCACITVCSLILFEITALGHYVSRMQQTQR